MATSLKIVTLRVLLPVINFFLPLILYIYRMFVPAIPDPHEKRPPLTIPSNILSKKWDYIVIGTGASGAVLAEKLSRNPEKSILVVEAGPRDIVDLKRVKNPSPWTTIHRDRLYDWNHRTTPQEYLNNRIMEVHRGKIVGGSSSINGIPCVFFFHFL